jgi:hypothetical protein
LSAINLFTVQGKEIKILPILVNAAYLETRQIIDLLTLKRAVLGKLITRLFRVLTTIESIDTKSTGIMHLVEKVIAMEVIRESEVDDKHKYDFDISNVEEELSQLIGKLLHYHLWLI